MARKTKKRGADEHNTVPSLRVDGAVGREAAIGDDGLLGEKGTWWSAISHAQDACANHFYILYRNGPCK